MRQHTWTWAALVLGTVWAGCGGANQPQASSLGERVNTIAASKQTTSETGIIAWEVYRNGEGATALGLDAKGKPLFHQQVVVDRSSGSTTVQINVPAHKKFIINKDKSATVLVDSQDPRIPQMMARLQTDVGLQAAAGAAVSYDYQECQAACWVGFASCAYGCSFFPVCEPLCFAALFLCLDQCPPPPGYDGGGGGGPDPCSDCGGGHIVCYPQQCP